MNCIEIILLKLYRSVHIIAVSYTFQFLARLRFSV